MVKMNNLAKIVILMNLNNLLIKYNLIKLLEERLVAVIFDRKLLVILWSLIKMKKGKLKEELLLLIKEFKVFWQEILLIKPKSL